MAAQSSKGRNKEGPDVAIVIAALAIVALVVLIGGMARHYYFSNPNANALIKGMDLDKHPVPSWVAKDAQQCKGDISQLSPQEQQKLYAAYPGQGAKSIIAAAYLQNQ